MGWLRGIDKRIFNLTLRLSQENYLHKYMRRISRSGDWGMIWLFVCFVLLYWRQYRRTLELCLFALLLTTVLSEGLLKRIFRRPRPYVTHGPVHMSIPLPTSFSFPSGHMASSVACARILISINLWIGIPAFIYAGLMGVSRVYLKAHYVTDVVAGGVIGLLCAEFVRWYFR